MKEVNIYQLTLMREVNSYEYLLTMMREVNMFAKLSGWSIQ
jgi:hypothetical protein